MLNNSVRSRFLRNYLNPQANDALYSNVKEQKHLGHFIFYGLTLILSIEKKIKIQIKYPVSDMS